MTDLKTKGPKGPKTLPLLKRGMFTNDATDEDTRDALARKETALSMAGLGQAKFVANMCSTIPFQLPTTDVDTMAVTMSGDGGKYLLLNPGFTNSLVGDKDVLFILYHECLHLLLNHLQRDADLRSDPVWSYSCEAVINATVLERLGGRDMPMVKRVDKTGKTVTEPSGVDPRKVHADYVKQCQENGLTHVSYDKFVESEQSCYSELKRLPDPPGQKANDQQCVHQGDAADGSGGEGGMQMDPETLSQAVKDAIQQTMTEARQGNEKAREELLKLAGLTEDGNEEAQKMWGLLGIGALRGTTDATRKVEYWKQWLNDVVGSKLQPGTRLIYPKKRAGVTMTLGLDPMLARRGDDRMVVLDVFLDTSGSVPQSVIEHIEKLVGDVPGVCVRYYMFDGIVMPLKPGERIMGGGGTNFQNCVEVAEGRLEVEGDIRDDEPDAVIMLTDGYAPKVMPEDPGKWIWLITPGGDGWSGDFPYDMETHVMDMSE
jgi:predicted metal-dependent peptidase